MGDWKTRYADKLCSADEAVQDVKHGQRVFIGSGAGQPETLVEALAKRRDLEDTEIVHIMTLGIAPYADSKLGAQFRHNAFFIGPNVREAVTQGRADYTPIFLSEIPHLFKKGRIVNDVAFVQVCPPDEHGYCSYGVSTDIVKSAAENAKVVIAEVNSNTPRSLGDCFINVRDIDRLVESDRPILEAPQGEPDDLARSIAKHIADLIDDGSTLQLGIGTIPDAVLHFLTSHKDLGIHTEMFSDGIIPLVEKGVVTNNKKTLHRGKIIASFVLGSRKLYDFIDNNPMVEFHPTEYTNDPFIICQNEKMVSINSALEIDLTGQVCADSLGTMFYSGIGGQVDFVRGASRSKGGKAIIALPSTAADGTYSRIVPTLKQGAGVVTSRGDVHYIVTEFGIAYLHGKTMRERAMALIQIAHPKFRPWLMAEAKARHMVYADQVEMPVETPTYPEHLEKQIELSDGSKVLLRPLRLTDEPRIRELFYTLSDESVYHRFFHALKSMPHSRLQKIMTVDYKTTMAMVACASTDADAPIIGIGHYVVEPKSNLAEVAFLVADEHQRKGIGSAMLDTLTETAKSAGVKGFTAYVMADNRPMLKVFHSAFEKMESSFEGDVYSLTIVFDQ